MSIHETFAQQMARVQQMADDADGMTWEFDENDRAALAALLASHDALRRAFKALEDLAIWDADGAVKPANPVMTWESVARIALDVARGMRAQAEGRS